jgi:DNA processing protein
MQISKLAVTDPAYPDQLRQIASPPQRLFICGQLPDAPMVAIVGTRRPTDYGRRVTYQLASELAQAGIAIVSGLAYGLDAVAHQAALDAGGKTVAILAGGLDVIYPAGHRRLAQDILTKGGALVSENDSDSMSFKSSFPARNRIISGLSLAVIVPEAGSGSMITASHALGQDRLVMAVPGNITSYPSAGPNNLIKAGAIPITDSSDVLAALDFKKVGQPSVAIPKSSEEALILDLMKQGLSKTDELIRQSQLPAAQFANVISLMEITGKVRNLGAGNWIVR